MLSMNCAICWYYLEFLLLYSDFHIARAMYPQCLIDFHCQQKDSEEEVEEIIRNILQLQGKVTILGGKLLQIMKFLLTTMLLLGITSPVSGPNVFPHCWIHSVCMDYLSICIAMIHINVWTCFVCLFVCFCTDGRSSHSLANSFVQKSSIPFWQLKSREDCGASPPHC